MIIRFSSTLQRKWQLKFKEVSSVLLTENGPQTTVDRPEYNVPITKYKVWIINLVTPRLGCRQWTVDRWQNVVKFC